MILAARNIPSGEYPFTIDFPAKVFNRWCYA